MSETEVEQDGAENVQKQVNDELDAEMGSIDHLSRFQLAARGGEVLKIKKSGSDLVCNFEVKRIRSGRARYLNGRSTPVHEVTVLRSDGTMEQWTLQGDLFDISTWREAGQNNAVITKASKFLTYLAHLTTHENVQLDDPAVNVTYSTGLVRDSNIIKVSDGVHFPGGDEECAYSGITFPRDGDKGIFDRLADLTKCDTVRSLLVHQCGAPLKVVFGFYPNCFETADKESGKTTQKQQIATRLRLNMVDAPVQFQTPYRRKKTLSNSNVPIMADEVGRMTSSNLDHLVNNLNSAYNQAVSTHGSGDKVYVLMTPVLLMGQDCPVRDEALLAKTVIYRLKKDSKSPEALKELRKSDAYFPFGDWLEFAADYANDHDLLKMLGSKVTLLRDKLPERVAARCAEGDRTIANYSTQLVAADLLCEYGVDAEIEDYVVARLIEHLRMLTEQGHNIAQAFLCDLMTVLGAGDSRARAACSHEDEGLYVHVGNAHEALQRRGFDYDVSDPRTITRLIRERGLAQEKPDRHRFNGVRLRCVFVPEVTLRELGYEG
ncbi:MAG: hypothetical protein ACOC0A_00205 [Planctomycetota bacterium]